MWEEMGAAFSWSLNDANPEGRYLGLQTIPTQF
jgi:hypothetical protein